ADLASELDRDGGDLDAVGEGARVLTLDGVQAECGRRVDHLVHQRADRVEHVLGRYISRYQLVDVARARQALRRRGLIDADGVRDPLADYHGVARRLGGAHARLGRERVHDVDALAPRIVDDDLRVAARLDRGDQRGVEPHTDLGEHVAAVVEERLPERAAERDVVDWDDAHVAYRRSIECVAARLPRLPAAG